MKRAARWGWRKKGGEELQDKGTLSSGLPMRLRAVLDAGRHRPGKPKDDVYRIPTSGCTLILSIMSEHLFAITPGPLRCLIRGLTPPARQR